MLVSVALSSIDWAISAIWAVLDFSYAFQIEIRV